MKREKVILILSVAILILAAFFLGQKTQISRAKKSRVKERPAYNTQRTAKKKAAAPAQALPPVPVKKSSRPAKVAIVIDDFGYNTNNLETLYSIKLPLTFSILPGLRCSREIAESAASHGYETILHLPLASHRKDVKEESETIRPGENKKEIVERLSKDIDSVPGICGVSNHMGSLATEDKVLMSEIFYYLKKSGFYYFDSLTSEKSVCREAAAGIHIRFARRDMFLDNESSAEYIEKQLDILEKLAFKRGRAIAICHDRKSTAVVLAKVMPRMARDGIEFVYLSDMVD